MTAARKPIQHGDTFVYGARLVDWDNILWRPFKARMPSTAGLHRDLACLLIPQREHPEHHTRFKFNLPYASVGGHFQGLCSGCMSDDEEQGFRWNLRVSSVETGASFDSEIFNYRRDRPFEWSVTRWWKRRGVLSHKDDKGEEERLVDAAHLLIRRAQAFLDEESGTQEVLAALQSLCRKQGCLLSFETTHAPRAFTAIVLKDAERIVSDSLGETKAEAAAMAYDKLLLWDAECAEGGEFTAAGTGEKIDSAPEPTVRGKKVGTLPSTGDES